MAPRCQLLALTYLPGLDSKPFVEGIKPLEKKSWWWPFKFHLHTGRM
jgi:hypothetical protein